MGNKRRCEQMIEDRRKICELLVPVLREMDGMRNVTGLDYRPDREIVYVIFATGLQRAVDAGGTGAQMVQNIVQCA